MWKRIVMRMFLVIASVAGTSVLGATAAQAAPRWQKSKITPTWSCTPWGNSASGVQFKACVVVNRNNDAQAVVVVRNPTRRAHSIQANRVSLYRGKPRIEQMGPQEACHNSSLSAGQSRACFGTTYHVGRCNRVHARITVTVGGEPHSPDSPWRKTAC